ncbi:MAG: fumarylacetoacetate hydrolase [Planctomycetes bacterium]|nr:fumarylacetoacetate hydrolase [Planctomycetota bacterium]
MKLVTFVKDAGEAPRVGALLTEGQEILDFTAPACGISAPAHHLDWLDLDGEAFREAHDLFGRLRSDPAALTTLSAQDGVLSASDVLLVAPVPRPGKVICIGLNYRDHAIESGMDIPESPVVFSKFPTSVIGPGGPVVLPDGSQEVDYEAELAVVIGRRVSRITIDVAYDAVLGYMNFNDVSARDFQFKDGQWQRGKSCDTFAPMGTYIATKDEIPDPHSLRIRLRLNGETLQDSNTNQLIFGIPQLVSFLSQTITLEPGDVIATGTPPGVGFARKPPIYIQDGDRMEVEIDGLGILENPVTKLGV